jgi:putative copper export protein
MPWDMIFEWANLYAMLCWAFLAFAPRREQIVPYLFYAGCGVLALTYAGLIVSLMTGLISDGGAPGGPSADFTTLAGIMAIFDTPGGATIGWIHYLAFDLFIGIWAARNADRRQINRIIQVPILFFILMVGPLGLTLYLVLRQFVGQRPENTTVPS